MEEAELHEEEKEFLAHRLRKMTMKRNVNSDKSNEILSPILEQSSKSYLSLDNISEE